MATVNDVLNKARGEIGYSRWNDPETGTKYGRYYAQLVGDKGFAANGVAYCAMFVTWVFRHVGQSFPGDPFAYCPYGVNAARSSGRAYSAKQAQPGDIVFFDWEGDGVSDHTGIVESNNGSYLTCIEGNTSLNGVSGVVARKTRAYSTVVCVCRPNYGTSSSTSGNTSGGKLTNEQVAQKVVNGEYGNNPERANKLKAEGYDPDTIQKLVNSILGGSNGSTSNKQSNEVIAQQVINGQWGNNPERAEKLKKAGYDPNTIQAIVNQKLKGGTVTATPSVNTSVPAGKYKILVNDLQVRTGPSRTSSSVASYNAGQTVNLDGWSTNSGGFIWGRYTGGSGNLRYIAVRETTGKEYAKKV